MVFFVLSLIVIIVLSLLLIQCRKKDKFCNCFGPGIKKCPDPRKIQDAYFKGSNFEAV